VKFPKIGKIKVKKIKISGGIQKFITVFSVSMIPVLIAIFIMGTSLFYVEQTTRIDLHGDYVLEVEKNQELLLNSSKRNFIESFTGLKRTAEIVDRHVANLIGQNTSQALSSYYYNQTIDGKDLNLEFSKKHNLDVDFHHSSYFVYQQPTYGSWSAEVNQSIRMSSNLDLILPAVYSTFPQILWVDLVFNTGVVRGYPYVERNITNYDLSQFDWYTKTVSTNGTDRGDLYYSDATIDKMTGKLVINAAHNIIVNGSSVAVLNMVIDFSRLNSLIQDLSTNTFDTTAYLFDSNLKVRAHPRLSVPAFGWNETYLNTSVADIELVDGNYSSALNTSVIFGYLYEKIMVNGTFYVLDIIDLNYSDLHLAVIRPLEDFNVSAGFPLVNILLIPAIAVLSIIAVILALQRKWGFLKGKNLQDLIDSMDSVATKFESIQERMTNRAENLDLNEMVKEASTTVAETVAETVKKEGDKLKEKIEEKGDEIVEKFDDAVEKIESADVDSIVDMADKKIDELTLSSKIDNIVRAMDSSEGFLDRLSEVGLDAEKLQQGDLNALSAIENPATKLLAIAATTDEIKLEKLAGTLSIEKMDLQSFLSYLPADKGISLDVDTVKFNKDVVTKNLPEILSIAKESFL